MQQQREIHWINWNLAITIARAWVSAQTEKQAEKFEQEGVWRSARVAQEQQQSEQVEEEQQQQQEERGKGPLCALASTRAASKQDSGLALVNAPKEREAMAQGLEKEVKPTIATVLLQRQLVAAGVGGLIHLVPLPYPRFRRAACLLFFLFLFSS